MTGLSEENRALVVKHLPEWRAPDIDAPVIAFSKALLNRVMDACREEGKGSVACSAEPSLASPTDGPVGASTSSSAVKTSAPEPSAANGGNGVPNPAAEARGDEESSLQPGSPDVVEDIRLELVEGKPRPWGMGLGFISDDEFAGMVADQLDEDHHTGAMLQEARDREAAWAE